MSIPHRQCKTIFEREVHEYKIVSIPHRQCKTFMPSFNLKELEKLVSIPHRQCKTNICQI